MEDKSEDFTQGDSDVGNADITGPTQEDGKVNERVNRLLREKYKLNDTQPLEETGESQFHFNNEPDTVSLSTFPEDTQPINTIRTQKNDDVDAEADITRTQDISTISQQLQVPGTLEKADIDVENTSLQSSSPQKAKVIRESILHKSGALIQDAKLPSDVINSDDDDVAEGDKTTQQSDASVVVSSQRDGDTRPIRTLSAGNSRAASSSGNDSKNSGKKSTISSLKTSSEPRSVNVSSSLPSKQGTQEITSGDLTSELGYQGPDAEEISEDENVVGLEVPDTYVISDSVPKTKPTNLPTQPINEEASIIIENPVEEAAETTKDDAINDTADVEMVEESTNVDDETDVGMEDNQEESLIVNRRRLKDNTQVIASQDDIVQHANTYKVRSQLPRIDDNSISLSQIAAASQFSQTDFSKDTPISLGIRINPNLPDRLRARSFHVPTIDESKEEILSDASRDSSDDESTVMNKSMANTSNVDDNADRFVFKNWNYQHEKATKIDG
ncbi:unnamed protein product [Ambrosiozyma monospora]|uniref:Unnamed protein product n=1 Tax=Ambrosiozyma monospora TaxID=43982 RepID=A0ACB5TCB6_AMBMO|nr:unnamed protein product [Ambrosiozyma monospora]